MKMDREVDLKKINVQTPRRVLGMSRMIPRTSTTPTAKRPNQQEVNLQQTPAVDKVVDVSSQTNEDYHLLTTPIKRRKVSGDESDLNMNREEENNSASENQKNKCENVKTTDELKAEILHMKTRLDKYEKHVSEKKELMRLIQLWCNGGKEALNTLKDEILPEQDINQIQTHLNLPLNIFDIT